MTPSQRTKIEHMLKVRDLDIYGRGVKGELLVRVTIAKKKVLEYSITTRGGVSLMREGGFYD